MTVPTGLEPTRESLTGTATPKVSWRNFDGQLRSEMASPDLLHEHLETARAFRSGVQYQNRRNRHSRQFVIPQRSHVWCESALEADALLVLEFEGDDRKQTVLDHLIGAQNQTFRTLEQQARELADKTTSMAKAAALAERRLDEVRQAQFTTKDMADKLTHDLARVYGKNHLSVAVPTDDGKSYACRRGDKPGTDLSEGERTTLSLLYFFCGSWRMSRKLAPNRLRGSWSSTTRRVP